MGIVVRTTPGAADPGGLIRQTMRDIDPGASLSVVRTMDAIVGATIARPRFMSWIMSIYACIALAVAALGVYGIVAYGVERRTREIGVRLALGATRSRVLAGIGWNTSVLLVGGLMAGLAGALWLGRAMTSILFGVTPFDIRVYAIVTVTLAVVVSVAAALPARRATRVDPLVALRAE
jgi:ABC-type antimicrobial peptide transport system permease subunit